MIQNANVASESVKVENTLTLSPARLELIGAILNIIDRRFEGREDLDEEEHDTEPCGACLGTGFVLIPVGDFVKVSRAGSKGKCSTRVSSSTQTVGEPQTSSLSSNTSSDAASSQVILPVPVSITPANANPVATATLSNPVPIANPTPTTQSHTLLSPAASVPANTAPVLPALAPVAPLTPTTAAAPVAAVTLANATAAPPSAPPVAPTNPLPPVTAPIPGLHPLGPNTPAPHPDNALHAAAGGDRFYTVTKGIRVGVFSGWATTSPLVTGVGGASFTRFSTVHNAFAAYKQAYEANLVSYT